MAEQLTLGAILADARIRLGWTLRQTERATGVPNAHISQLETGAITAPGIAVLVKLAKAYGLPLRRLLEAAGNGADWALVIEAAEAEIRADERERIAADLERRAEVTPATPYGHAAAVSYRDVVQFIREQA